MKFVGSVTLHRSHTTVRMNKIVYLRLTYLFCTCLGPKKLTSSPEDMEVPPAIADFVHQQRVQQAADKPINKYSI